VSITTEPATDAEFLCRDCGASWKAQLAADECEILAAAETRAARNTRG